MGDGVEYGNDFSDGVVSMRNHHLLVIVVDHDIGRIHVVKDGDMGCEQDNDGNDIRDGWSWLGWSIRTNNFIGEPLWAWSRVWVLFLDRNY